MKLIVQRTVRVGHGQRQRRLAVVRKHGIHKPPTLLISVPLGRAKTQSQD